MVSTKEQDKFGKRHPQRFYACLMGEERDLDRAAGGPWRVVAVDRGRWRDRRKTWLEQQDLTWASHLQLAIEC